MNPDFTLIHQDEYLLVVGKPANLLSVPGRGVDKQDCLASRLQSHFPDALVVHRLDMATSGLMLFARGSAMQARLSQLFRERRVSKCYQAIVAGVPVTRRGEIDLPLICDWPNRPRQKVCFQTGKPALTRYRVLEEIAYASATASRMELEPITGRSHQLRLHLASLGHPIVGDALYGGMLAPRMMLHASELHFVHPASSEPMFFQLAANF